MGGWLQGLLGLLGLIGKLFDWRQQKNRDALIIEAESAKQSKEALKTAQEANKREAEIRTLPDSELDERLRKFERRT